MRVENLQKAVEANRRLEDLAKTITDLEISSNIQVRIFSAGGHEATPLSAFVDQEALRRCLLVEAQKALEALKAELRELGVDEGEILAAIGQKYRGDHNIETLFVILTRVAFERLQLLEALKGLIEASGGMAPVGAESKYEMAVERAEAAIAKVRV